MTLILFLAALFAHSVVGLLPNCVEPEMICPNVNITYWLYTRSNVDDPHQIFAMQPDTISSAPWVEEATVKILIHGYTGNKDFSPNTELRPVYLDYDDYNIISVDYNPIAREPCYIEAARNTELVGMCTAQLIDQLVQQHNFSLEQFHVVGFSLGAHVAGYTGQYLTSGQLPRITGLDPAMPLFVMVDNDHKLDASDARYVDVIHTNALHNGKLGPSGDSDFYANGGSQQPGCNRSEDILLNSCNHRRAVEYFTESITNYTKGFYGTRCVVLKEVCGEIGSDDEVLLGEYIDTSVEGNYIFFTNSASPFAQGKSE